MLRDVVKKRARSAEYPLARRGLVLLRGARSAPLGPGASAAAEVSNGAGKTTLAMAALWALTGGSDARADGKPIGARGIINDRSVLSYPCTPSTSILAYLRANILT